MSPPFALLDALTAPAWATDAGGNLVFVNRAFARYSGVSTDGAGGLFAEVLHPGDREDALASWQRSWLEGTPCEHEARLRGRDGSYRWFCVQGQSASVGTEVSWVAVAHDIHALKRVEARAVQVQEVTATLAGAHDVSGVLGALPLCARVLDAPRASVTVLRAGGRELHLIGAHGYPEEGLRAFRVLPAHLSVPAADVLRGGEPLILPYERFASQYPHLVGRQDTPSGTLALLPLITDGRAVGVLTLGFVEAREVDGAERRFMLTLAGVLAQALERARLFEEERVTRLRARALLDAAPQLMWTSRPVDTLVQFNHTWAEYTGLGERLEQDAWEQVIHPGDLPALRAARQQGLSRGQTYTCEVRLRRRDGAYRWHHVQVRPLADGEWLGSATDVHDRQETQLALAGSEARFRELADHMSQFAWTTDASGAITWYNRRWYDYTGTTLDEMQGWGWTRVHHPDHVDRVVEKFSRAVEMGDVWEDTFPLRGKGGGYRWFLSRAVPIRDEGGRVVRWFGTNTDVTEQREAQARLRDLNASLEARVTARTAELQRSNERLQRSNAELERFAYVASHDLQEPIRTVSSFAGLLLKKYEAHLDDKGRLYLNMLLKGTGRMKTLVDDLLTFSRLSGDQVPLRPLDLEVPFADALSRLHIRVSATGARVTHDPLPTVLGDGPQLAQLFQNLLGNALKFTRPDVRPEVHVGVGREGEVWHIRVTDNGIGIEPEYLERIFVMFQRLHSREQYEGTGLGLSICQKTVEGHGGRLWVESVPGQGSTFHFTLRAAGGRPCGGEAPPLSPA